MMILIDLCMFTNDPVVIFFSIQYVIRPFEAYITLNNFILTNIWFIHKVGQ